MKKSIMKFNVLIFTGLLGLGLMTSPIDAEEGQETRANEKNMSTEVIYNSTEYDIEPLDVIVMKVPSSINLSKSNLTRNASVSIELNNGQKFNKYDGTGDKKFETVIDVMSKSNGKLLSLDSSSSISANYVLKNKKFAPVNWNDSNKGKGFIRFKKDAGYNLNSTILSEQIEVKVEGDQSKILEEARSGSSFSDILTFKIALIKGNGFKSYTGQ